MRKENSSYARRALQSVQALVEFLLWTIYASMTGLAAESVYSFDIVARTVPPTLGGNAVVSLGWGPSINDAGKVAFIARVQDGRRGIYVKGTEAEDRRRLASSFTFGDVPQVNNQDQVAWREVARDGLISFVKRLGANGQTDFRIVAQTYLPNPIPDLA
jgi:hypothetical protein